MTTTLLIMKVCASTRLVGLAGTGTLLLAIGCFWSSSPRPRRGALAGAADTVARDFDIECNGPDACFGYRGAELGFFETDLSGEVQFVARRRYLTRAAANSLAIHLRDSLDDANGAGTACPRANAREERQWATDGSQVSIALYNLSSPDSAAVVIVRRKKSASCGIQEEPQKFM